ncbi:MAG: tryptophan synthase subunit alpha [Sulfurimonas sp. RIFCSPHIGHO2_12_FULL_36_9]|uniref:tryptophan synthase subunit alpha n=1 Tax=Sulfurimonas sp. RIFCSPLOWO2_12_36_12 TaxID=1802253 RepID=UPI0008B41ECB|nr:tryptophan synthase subunit alpha [Sulfurimonas sp. RIFCSPLOWO2_12_36_12]OHD97209.1 MAG: tryptophan synthase subunit alpha [Sulfurimonas sp. RIFCSPHIGHO2_12_FULL_36_9]OHE00104.1 MAG: tryptophan synthase subunit alpha [Sulfurimonas sp. RIFCSPLOWO2_02_FULL_36_28]OHE03044.1 MAG: tryptophan synthase subunit alpha [Sulfurimonas sp. RIFCSPLOWO2_12_36_12]OHE05504.1 MAG: tryptophan synthase subunit alpha [Sulfurimonas sp. RIFCSPLOWO2_12_FULL_36_74]
MKKLVAYITTGYPEKSFSIDLALALGESGVDTLELGVPFSDPVADGPLIEKANHKALELGFKFKHLLEISKAVAPKVDTLWMGYFNSFYQQNMEELVPLAKEIGINGLIIPDLPHEEALAYRELFNSNNVSNISFVAPTDSEKRIQEIVKDSKKFIYMVAYTGITGSGSAEDLQPFLSSIKKYTATPVYVGFGVNKNTAKDKVKGADGVIVGSAFIDILLKESLSYENKIKECSELAKILKSEINS